MLLGQQKMGCGVSVELCSINIEQKIYITITYNILFLKRA